MSNKRRSLQLATFQANGCVNWNNSSSIAAGIHLGNHLNGSERWKSVNNGGKTCEWVTFSSNEGNCEASQAVVSV